jgi:hypothetical protein
MVKMNLGQAPKPIERRSLPVKKIKAQKSTSARINPGVAKL